MYAIMGATGNVGSKVADNLLSRGEKVRVVARSEEKLKPFMDRGAEVAAGDAVDVSFLTKAFTGANAVFTMSPSDDENRKRDDLCSCRASLVCGKSGPEDRAKG